jgi:hypothetical protein
MVYSLCLARPGGNLDSGLPPRDYGQAEQAVHYAPRDLWRHFVPAQTLSLISGSTHG